MGKTVESHTYQHIQNIAKNGNFKLVGLQDWRNFLFKKHSITAI